MLLHLSSLSSFLGFLLQHFSQSSPRPLHSHHLSCSSSSQWSLAPSFHMTLTSHLYILWPITWLCYLLASNLMSCPFLCFKVWCWQIVSSQDLTSSWGLPTDPCHHTSSSNSPPPSWTTLLWHSHDEQGRLHTVPAIPCSTLQYNSCLSSSWDIAHHNRNPHCNRTGLSTSLCASGKSDLNPVPSTADLSISSIQKVLTYHSGRLELKDISDMNFLVWFPSLLTKIMFPASY